MEGRKDIALSHRGQQRQRYRAVIFDLFGTLIENFRRPEYERVLEEMAEILGIPAGEFKRLWAGFFLERTLGIHRNQRDSIVHICRTLNIQPQDSQVEHAFRVRLDYTRRSMQVRPYAIETLSALKRGSYKIGLISDCSGEIPLIWKDTPLAPYFDVTVFSCTAGIKKPDPRIYHLATEALGVVPGECLYVGDGSSRELSGARAVGMRAVLIRDPAEPADSHTVDREQNWDGDVIASL
ncbi:MAG: HAD-IA family hydrolase, partial [Dehalococcoidales bacterium]|nr:HAD-IA family hydrolase [Dehalococcoidales bacterium]